MDNKQNKKHDTPSNNLLSSDTTRITKTHLLFGPLSIKRVSDIPDNSYGRNGDIVVLDNTASKLEKQAIEISPETVGIYQKVPCDVPSGPVVYRTSGGGLELNIGESIQINNRVIVFTGGGLDTLASDIKDQTYNSPFPINAQVIPFSMTGRPGGVPKPGDSLNISIGSGPIHTVNFKKPYTLSSAITQINDLQIPGLIVNSVGDKLVFTVPSGNYLELRNHSGNPMDNIGPFDKAGGALLMTELNGSEGFVFSSPVGSSALKFSTMVSNQAPSPTIIGGVWKPISGDSERNGKTVYGSVSKGVMVTNSGINQSWSSDNIIFVSGSGNPVIVSNAIQINEGRNVGDELKIFGTSDTNTVTFKNGNGLRLKGSITLSNNDSLCLIWNGKFWSEIYRSLKNF